MAIISENRRNTPQYQMNGARRALSLGLNPPQGQVPTDPQAMNPNFQALSTTSNLTAQPNPPTNYDEMFRKSIDEQRATIDAQLRSAMGDLGRRETAAQGMLNLQPGEVNKLYDQATPAIQAMAKQGAQTQQALNVPQLPGVPVGAGTEASQQALALARAGSLADKPYLDIGTSELYQRQRGALGNAAMEARQQVASQQQDYYMQKAQAQAQEDSFYAHSMFQDKLDQAREGRQSEAKTAEERRLMRASEPPKGTAKWWEWNMRLHPQQAHDFGQGHVADYITQQITHGLAKPTDEGMDYAPATVKQLMKKYRNNPQVLAWLDYNRASLSGRAGKRHAIKGTKRFSGQRSILGAALNGLGLEGGSARRDRAEIDNYYRQQNQ